MEATLKYGSIHWGATMEGRYSNLPKTDKSPGKDP